MRNTIAFTISLFAIMSCGPSQEDLGPQVRYVVGPTGSDGQDGSPGEVGATGSQGVQGATGLQGISGPTGSLGPTGAQGVTGASGINGDEIEAHPFCPDMHGGIGLQESYVLIDNWPYAVYADSKGHTFLGKIPPGYYQTTDGRPCRFVVTSDGKIE